jgi:NADPH:quinone reductase-like Zn-dependent oxidoreductase
VLVKVGACGLNNTDINTREGWYSKAVTGATGSTADTARRPAARIRPGAARPSPSRASRGPTRAGGSWPSARGRPARIGERVITDNWLRDPDDLTDKTKTGYFGSERDGGFAEYTTMPARNALAVNSPLSDAELATFSCSYSTAEGMLTRARVTDADTVLIPGASGGVGGALVQLAKLRGARVIALASEAKHGDVAALGADVVLPRAPADLRSALRAKAITVLADVVGGPGLAGPRRHAGTRRALHLFGRHRRADGRSGPAHALPARPDLHRLHRHRPGGHAEPRRLHRKRRDQAGPRRDLSP